MKSQVEYRARDYLIAFVQTLLMSKEEIGTLEAKISVCGETEDICEHIAKQRYQQYKKNMKIKFQERKYLGDYKI